MSDEDTLKTKLIAAAHGEEWDGKEWDGDGWSVLTYLSQRYEEPPVEVEEHETLLASKVEASKKKVEAANEVLLQAKNKFFYAISEAGGHGATLLDDEEWDKAGWAILFQIFQYKLDLTEADSNLASAEMKYACDLLNQAEDALLCSRIHVMSSVEHRRELSELKDE